MVADAFATTAAEMLGGAHAEADGAGGSSGGLGIDAEGMMQMMGGMPIGRAAMFPGSPLDLEQLEQLVAAADAPPV